MTIVRTSKPKARRKAAPLLGRYCGRQRGRWTTSKYHAELQANPERKLVLWTEDGGQYIS